MTKEEARERINNIITRQESDCLYITIISRADCEALKIAQKAFEDQKEGEWKEVYTEATARNGWIEFACPECEHLHRLEYGQYRWSYGKTIPWKYCPICGSRMKEGDRNE